MTSIFTDAGQTLENFAETIYVCCPVCKKCAQVKRIPSDEQEIVADISRRYNTWRYREHLGAMIRFRRSFSPRKLSCFHCGYTKTWQGNGRGRSGPQDWYFGLPLWLQTPCSGKILWAFNEEHVSFLERYVTATQRIKFRAKGQIRNGTMASRLPLWMKSAKNRDEIVKGVARLKGMLERL